MNLGIIIYLLLNLVTLGIISLFRKRITIPAGIAICLLVGIVFVFLSNPIEQPYFMLAPLICAGAYVGIKYKFPDINYNKRILNLAPIKRSKEGRVIGKCFPYYKKQLKYNHATIVQSELAMKGGTILTGSSGSGKTYGIINSIGQDLVSGKSVVFIDFKGDTSTLNELEKNCPSNVKIFKLTWEECNFIYDPLINLDENGKVESILNMRKWDLSGSDEHYRTGTQLLLQKTIHEYQHQGGNYLVGYYKFLQTYNVPREHFEAYNTVIKLLELTMSSNVRNLFDNQGNEFKFDMKEQYLTFVSFSSASKALGTSLTSLMLNDLMEVGTRRAYNPTLCLYVDEFGSAQNPLLIKDILEKGRSCNIATMLSMQDLNQLIINTNAPFMDSVLGTVNSYIIYAGATRNTAEKVSGVQIFEIEELLMSLRKPDPSTGKPPTAVYISKYPIFRKGGTEVYRFIPIKNKNTNNVGIRKSLNETPSLNSNVPAAESVQNKFVEQVDAAQSQPAMPQSNHSSIPVTEQPDSIPQVQEESNAPLSADDYL